MEMKHYEALLNKRGVSGNEKSVRNYLETEYKKYDVEILKDNLGGIFAVKKGNKDDLRIVVAAHMDEVGAMVSNITKDGFVKFIAIGGVIPEVFVSQHIEIITKDDKIVNGVIASIPPHLNSEQKDFKIENLFIDLGLSSKQEVLDLGIDIGSFVNFKNQYYNLSDPNKIVSKAWDNRFGCAMTITLLESIQNVTHNNTLIFGATVQEEVGLRGAKVASQMLKPDLFIALDASPTSDFLNAPEGFGKLGEGFLVRMYDPGYIMNSQVKEYITSLAIKNNIKFQEFFSKGGTDAAAAQYNSEVALTIGLPCRYIHSTASIVDKRDIEAVKEILIAIIKDLDKEKFLKIKK